MEVKIKKLNPNAKIPAYALPGDAGMDLTAVSKTWNLEHNYWEYGTGLAFEIPEGYVGLVFPRSSSRKTPAIMANCVGVVDSQYRGEVFCSFKNLGLYAEHPYEVGDRVGQIIIIPYPQIQFVEVEELSETVRGEGGHGSTGK